MREGAVVRINDKKIINERYRKRLGILLDEKSGGTYKASIPAVNFTGNIIEGDFKIISVCGRHLDLVYHDSKQEYICPFCEEEDNGI